MIVSSTCGCEQLMNLLPQDGCANGFRHVCCETGRHTFFAVAVHGESRDSDDGQIRKRRVLSNSLGDLKSI